MPKTAPAASKTGKSTPKVTKAPGRAGRTSKAAAKSAGPKPVRARICVDFSTYPDNTPLGPVYTQAGFIFKQLVPAPVMFANATAGQIGLQFPDGGLDVKLPALTRRVTMLFGTFGGPVQLEIRNGATLIATRTLNTANAYQNIVVTAPPSFFNRLVFKGGHNEGILVRICADYVFCY